MILKFSEVTRFLDEEVEVLKGPAENVLERMSAEKKRIMHKERPKG